MSTSHKMNLSIDEIAAEAGASRSTVYRVMREGGKNTDSRHRKIRNLLIGSGYLASAQGPLLFVSPPTMTSHCYALFRFVREICADRDIPLFHALDVDAESESRRNRVAGVISVCELPDLPMEIPCVYLNRIDKYGLRSSVTADRYKGLLRIFAGLVARGKRRIGYFSEYAPATKVQITKQGLFYLPDCYCDNGLDFPEDLVYAENFSPVTHYAACSRAAEFFAARRDRLDVLVLYSDVYAYHVVRKLRDMGLKFPGPVDLAVLDDSMKWPLPESGLDEAVSEAHAHSEAAMIYGRTPLKEMAETAVDQVLATIQWPDRSPQSVMLGMEIVSSEKRQP